MREKAFEKHGSIEAVPEAKAFVAVFFERRKVAIDRQKALQLNDEAKAEKLEDTIEELQEKEEKAKKAYSEALIHGSKLKTNDAAATSASSNGPSKSGNVYGDAFEKKAKQVVQQAEDDFM